MTRRPTAIVIALLFTSVAFAEPVRVEVKQRPDGGWDLTRGGQPYFIKGGGGNGSREVLANLGGNSIRTWGTDGLDAVLDEAQKLKLTVAVGIWLGQPRHGFKYSDPNQVERQEAMVRRVVQRYKDHPAVLIWGLGNEVESNGQEDNVAIYTAVNRAAKIVHEVDPNHPTMTVFAEISARKVEHFNALCPDVDVLGINAYGGVATVPNRYAKWGGRRPYVVTEFGPPGIWESPKTSFGAGIELSSTRKAERYRVAYEKAVAGAPGVCLGSYAFMWGHKQEATGTWFGTFLADGTRTGAIDVLGEMWSGNPPANRCPTIEKLEVDGANDVPPGATVHATVRAADPEHDPLTVKWVLQAEQWSFSVGGDREAAPPTFPEAILKGDAAAADVRLPDKPGTYRLFAYVTDDHGGGAVANVPVHVKAK